MRKLLVPLAALCLFGFDGGGCDDDEPDPEPLRKDHEFRADELNVRVKIQRTHLVSIAISMGRPYTINGSSDSEQIAIASSRFFWNGTEIFAPYDWTLDASIEASTLTYVDVEGATHDIALPAVPDTLLSESLPTTVSIAEPLEIFWDGPPEAAIDDDVRVEVRNPDNLVHRTQYADAGAQSVIFPASVLGEFGVGPVEVEVVRERYFRDVAGTNGGWIITWARSPKLGTTLE